MSASSEVKLKTVRVPDTLAIIFGVVILSWILTFFVTPGFFETVDVKYNMGDSEVTKTVLKSGSFQYADGKGQGAPIFATDDSSSLLAFAFNGLTSGSKFGASIGVMAFLLIIGGAFGILLDTQAVDLALKRLVTRMQGREYLLVPMLCLIFSLGGAVFGMGEEAIAFAMILTPVIIKLGYDGITAVMCTYVSTQIGFASSWMNPFNVAVAQGLSGIPIYSGSELRIAMWLVFTAVLIIYTSMYSHRIKRQPQLSKSVHSDEYFRRQNQMEKFISSELHLGHYLVLATLVGTLVWVIWGVIQYGYYIPEIATQFFTMGLIAGVVACVFKLNGFTINRVAESFRNGASQMLAPALVVGLSQGVLIVLGGTDPETPSVLNSILFTVGEAFSNFSTSVAAVVMFLFQSSINFFVTSGSGQAALTMPLMAPIADLVGVTRQTAVLAFQLGDGLTNILVPTSASLMGTLGVARIQWVNWAGFTMRFLALNVVIAVIFIVTAVMINY